jgi:hypothetical protein
LLLVEIPDLPEALPNPAPQQLTLKEHLICPGMLRDNLPGFSPNGRSHLTQHT